MTDISEIFDEIPIGDIAKQLGVSKKEAEEGVALALPSLLRGLQANAEDPKGAASLLNALGEKDTGLIDGGIDLGDVDVEDGEKIVKHIFGKSADKVPARLGGAGSVGSDLIKQLLPILAPIVLAYVVKRMTGDKGDSSTGGLTDILGGMLGGGGTGGAITDILGGVLGGMANGGGSTSKSKKSSGSKKSPSDGVLGGISDILGGLLGGGTK